MGTAIILAILAIVVFVGIRSTVKRAAGGCCSGEGEKIRRIKPSDPDRSHYPYAVELSVDGMMCGGCETKVANALNLLNGVYAAADHSTGTVTVLLKEKVDESVLVNAVNEIGPYRVIQTRWVKG